MNKLQINRKHLVSPTQIEKFVYKNDIVWVYMKKPFYPPILKSECNAYVLRNRMVNIGLKITDFKVEIEYE